VVVAAAVTTIVLVTGGSGSPRVAAPEAKLPALHDPAPVLATLSASAPAPTPTALAAKLAPLLQSSALGSSVEAEVVDVATGRTLLDRNAGSPATPASTAKLLTSVAALTALDPEKTLATTVVAGARPGQVVLIGGGDPTLSTTSPSKDYPGAASVADLAGQVKAALGTPVTSVVVDDSLYSGPLTAPGWGPADAPSSYAAPVTAASVDGARVTPGLAQRSGTPATDAGRALAAALGASGAPVSLGTAPSGARTLGTVHSAPIARIVEQALAQSDNMLAEALARQVAVARHLPASFDGAAQAVTAALKDAGVDVRGVSLHDGSGLDKADAVPPSLLATLLEDAATGKIARAWPIVSGLSVAGFDGTLADRADDDPATSPGAVRAKTGTLAGVHNLAGTVLTKDGRLLVFAVVADRTTGGDAAAESALDRIAAALAGCGCR
jgi:D-alanyl-D-alanine carboxypeptidase/D-alanyl-D-alanine-endopeptidase (penicillin-binding protein 4)